MAAIIDYIREFKFDWKPQVHPDLLQGALFDRYDDDSTRLDPNVFLRIDGNGFFLYWKSEEGKEPGVLDLVQVWEARKGGLPRDGRVQFELEQRGPKETLEDRTVWVTYGEDLVNLYSVYFVARDLGTAEVWRSGINDILRTSKVKHTCYATRLLKIWHMLTLSLNERGKISIKNIVKLFSCGKDDAMTLKCLGDLGLYGDKEREDIDVENFPFERFLRLYYKISPRTDIQELFVKLSGKKEYLTRDRLTKFMNETQRDERLNELIVPLFNDARVQKLIIEKFETDEKYIREGKLSGDGFLRFMMADENSPVFIKSTEISQDMDLPLCSYYINSSHNTYLIGRQYGAKSSAEIYRQVLLSGCRCVELDCWDGTGENKGEPIITHGKAMCTDVFFRDVLYQIRDTAFARSEYPVILSLENHCSKANQLKMAKYMMEIFGDMLLSKPIDKCPLEPNVNLPSPNQLKYKILIKNKRLKPEVEKSQLETFYREGKLDEEEEVTETPEVTAEDEPIPSSVFDDQRAHPEMESRHGSQTLLTPRTAESLQLKEPDEAHPELKQNFMSKLKPLGFSKKAQGTAAEQPTSSAGSNGLTVSMSTSFRNRRSFRRSAFKPDSESASLSAALLDSQPQRNSSGRSKKKPFLTAEEETRIYEQYRYTGATTNIHPLLSSLVVYTCPVKFPGFPVPEDHNLRYQMSSFAESVALTILKQNAADFVPYNKQQLSRIYPKGARVDSSNFLPQVFWNVGCQMVALNFQTPDIHMQLNHGKFEWNGGCGYLLKPEFMRRMDKSFNPFAASPVDGVVAAQCSIKIISGHFLCNRRVGTYVEVEMYGLPSDTIRKEHRTRTVPANTLNPMYDSEPFVFRKVVLPELAVLRFAVYDELGKQIGQRILPFDGLQPGYRHITLRNESNISLILPTLFVYIGISTYVPDGMDNICNALAEPRRIHDSSQDKLEKALHNMGFDENDALEGQTVRDSLLRINGASNNAANPKLHQTSIRDTGLHKQLTDMEDSKRPRDGKQQSSSLRLSASSSPPKVNRGGLSVVIARRASEHFRSAESTGKMEDITVEELKKNKTFVKQMRRMEKDVEDLKARHDRQRLGIQKHQQEKVEKLICGSRKRSKKLKPNEDGKDCLHKPLTATTSDAPPSTSLVGDNKMRSLVMNQTKEWTNMMHRHESEYYEMRKIHVRCEYDLLSKLLTEAQKRQRSELHKRSDQEQKNLQVIQSQKSSDGRKAIYQDPNIKTKPEKDRRWREMCDEIMKVFLEQRRRLRQKVQMQEKHMEAKHNEQKEAVELAEKKALEQEEMSYKEAILALKPESVC